MTVQNRGTKSQGAHLVPGDGSCLNSETSLREESLNQRDFYLYSLSLDVQLKATATEILISS